MLTNNYIIELMNNCKTDPNKFRQEIFKDPDEFTKNVILSSYGYFQLFDIYGFDLLELLSPREFQFFITVSVTTLPITFIDLIHNSISH